MKRAVDRSFNRVSVDGDTSTNDMLAVLANGAAGNEPIMKPEGADFELFAGALTEVCRDLAIQVKRDGEGARKLITIRIRRAPNERDAARIARPSPQARWSRPPSRALTRTGGGFWPPPDAAA